MVVLMNQVVFNPVEIKVPQKVVTKELLVVVQKIELEQVLLGPQQ